MEGDHIRTYDWLMPLAWLYGIGVSIRNALFDLGVLRSRSYDVPVISVGNISVGGAGKTPHTEYLIQLLSKIGQVAVLSRGYKRKSRGYRLATSDTPMRDIGDEPYQMKHKFPKAHIAVDKDRRHGIEQLIKADVQPVADVIILDDAFQHRYVQPGINILLMDYHRLIYYDKLLPAGRLREHKSGIQRADIIIVTKCPLYITPMDRRGIEMSLTVEPWQHLFFTTFKYGTLYSLFTKEKLTDLTDKDVLLLSGIASPEQLEYDFAKICKDFTSLHYPDHHNFTKRDIATIEEKGKGKLIVTTEKDAARLQALGREAFSEETAKSIYVLPIEVEFMNERQEMFNDIITSYVRKNSRNSILLKAKDASKS